MQVFMATLSTETNTFCTMPTAMSGFEDYFLRHGTATEEPPNLMTEALHVWRKKAVALGWDVVESLAAIAEPAGPTTRACYDDLSGEILDDLAACGGADIILLQLHGAMVADHIEDCEGDILARVRAQCSDAVIGVSLDLHCHLTERMLAASDVIVCFKEYPHDDATARAQELFELVSRTASGQLRPKMAMFDARMINLYLTKTGAMREFVDEMTAYEAHPDVLSVSLAHGFPWANVSDVGARVLVVTHDNIDLANTLSEKLARRFYALRHKVTTPFLSTASALDVARPQSHHPVVLADMGDNSGGGAPGDATHLLRALLDGGFSNFAAGIFWDPIVVRICQDAGLGSTVKVRLGGKTSIDSGSPLDLTVEIRNIQSGLGQHLGTGREPLGTLVWVRLNGDVDLLINDLRVQVYHPEAFEQMGVGLSGKNLIAVKSLFHFFGPFSQISDCILQVATPGGTHPNFAKTPLTKRKTPFWPAVEAPFSEETPETNVDLKAVVTK